MGQEDSGSIWECYRGVYYGIGKDLLIERFPRPIGIIKGSNDNSLYIIDATTSFLIQKNKVIGVKIGRPIIYDMDKFLGFGERKVDNDIVTKEIHFGMTFGELKNVLNLKIDREPALNLLITKNKVGMMLELSSLTNNGKKKYYLDGLIIDCRDRGDNEFYDGISPEDKILLDF